jgi:hypothetical protein
MMRPSLIVPYSTHELLQDGNSGALSQSLSPTNELKKVTDISEHHNSNCRCSPPNKMTMLSVIISSDCYHRLQ